MIYQTGIPVTVVAERMPADAFLNTWIRCTVTCSLTEKQVLVGFTQYEEITHARVQEKAVAEVRKLLMSERCELIELREEVKRLQGRLAKATADLQSTLKPLPSRMIGGVVVDPCSPTSSAWQRNAMRPYNG